MYLTRILLPLCLLVIGWITQNQINNANSTENIQNNQVTNQNITQQNKQPTITENDLVIAAAGDIACDPANGNFNNGNGTEQSCRQKATSDLLINANLTAVLPLGDNQYEYGILSTFEQSYDPSWGRVKDISYPVAGNHEYYRDNAKGYYDYFGERAGDRAKGYYSYNLGNWHLIALNSNCSNIGGCDENSPQMQWLKEDLEAHKNQCTLAYFHHPRFSSGKHGNHAQLDQIWKTLNQAGVEVVLSGHDHHYERFAPQDSEGNLDYGQGMRQFVLGMGGRSHYPVVKIQPNSEVQNSNTYGVLKLTLHSESYSWEFVPEIGETFSDRGSDLCH